MLRKPTSLKTQDPLSQLKYNEISELDAPTSDFQSWKHSWSPDHVFSYVDKKPPRSETLVCIL